MVYSRVRVVEKVKQTCTGIMTIIQQLCYLTVIIVVLPAELIDLVCMILSTHLLIAHLMAPVRNRNMYRIIEGHRTSGYLLHCSVRQHNLSFDVIYVIYIDPEFTLVKSYFNESFHE